MHIHCLEISNFRKLLSVRIALADETTLFVGANNSGKTSAMLALRRFLVQSGKGFRMHDFTLSHWGAIDEIGVTWKAVQSDADVPDLKADEWTKRLPALDVWLAVDNGELHHVSALLPTLDWAGGLLGVRMRLEPLDLTDLFKDYRSAAADAELIRTAAAQPSPKSTSKKSKSAKDPEAESAPLTLWPTGMVDFLSRRLMKHFVVRSYALDPTKLIDPERDLARPQLLAPESQPIEGNALAGVIRINEINAQRGLGEAETPHVEDATATQRESRRLSDQLRIYYDAHLDPLKHPDPSDLGALRAIQAAQDAFDERLKESFSKAVTEVQGLGYPGVTDPKLKVSTRLRAMDGLNHDAAVSFEIDAVSGEGEVTPVLRLPENHNGLGYQNLISMVFKLMSFRDGWMRVGKAAKSERADVGVGHEPLHLVLIEEPEAHLHAQVQQVFIKRAYEILRQHPALGANKHLTTQLVVSTHSSHVAHETGFSCLRYFRRLPAGMACPIPVATVANLSAVFGEHDETEQFVMRYLRANHADLLFADAAILVEGPAERMLIPNFIRLHYEFLNQCYISMLEIGGSHAHKLKPLLERLGLLTLIVTDLDASDATTGKASLPSRGAHQVTTNPTLAQWAPKLTSIDELLDATPSDKVLGRVDDQMFAVRVAYQVPVSVALPSGGASSEVLPSTFEDALALENLVSFSTMSGDGLVRKFRDAIGVGPDALAVSQSMFNSLRGAKKAEFALDVIGSDAFDSLAVPNYIADGMAWLIERLKKKQEEVLPLPDGSGSGP